MAGATITTLSNILKEYYLPPVVEQLNNEVLMLSRIEGRSEDLFGKSAFVPLHTTRTGAVGARAELGTLPTAGNQGYQRAQYDLKYLYGVVQVSGPSMAKTASEAGAFLKSLQSELDGIKNDLRKDVSRQVYGTGDGVIATVAAGSTGTVINLSSDEVIRKGQVYVGMVIDVGTIANPVADCTAQSITAVTLAGPSVTVAASGTPAAGHFVFRTGANTASATNEILGLQAIVSGGTGSALGQLATTFVGAIDSTGAGLNFWQSQSLSLATFNLDNLQKCWGTVRIAGGESSVMIGSFGVQRTYYGLLQSQVRFNDPMTLKSGFQSLDFMGKPMIADVDAPYGKLYFLDERFFKTFTPRDWHFLDEDGLTLKWVSGLDAWQSILARYINLGVSRRNVQLVGTGITDATGV